jgi:hypothetical protein
VASEQIAMTVFQRPFASFRHVINDLQTRLRVQRWKSLNQLDRGFPNFQLSRQAQIEAESS